MTRRTGRLFIAALVCVLAMVSGCGSTTTAITPITGSVVSPLPQAATIATSPPSAAGAPGCDPTASLAPGPLPTPGDMPAGTSMATIEKRGRLIVGVDQNTYLFGFRDPRTGELSGFDIDIAKEIAKAIFGDPSKIQFTVLTSAQRIPSLQDHTVDLVVRTFSITCDRLQQIAFSAVYYQAQQRILTTTGSGINGVGDLGGKTVCATNGSTSLTHLLELDPRPDVLSVKDWSDCLVALQQGQVDAVSTDDPILQGLKAQDPNLQLVGDSLSPEPYGIGIGHGDTAMVRFVNGVLDQIRQDGTWKAIYQRWLGGDVPEPPTPNYSAG